MLDIETLAEIAMDALPEIIEELVRDEKPIDDAKTIAVEAVLQECRIFATTKLVRAIVTEMY